MISHVIEDFRNQANNAHIQLTYASGITDETNEDNNSIIVEADKSRLTQVISN
jgi:signal transduction histidine kinase